MDDVYNHLHDSQHASKKSVSNAAFLCLFSLCPSFPEVVNNMPGEFEQKSNYLYSCRFPDSLGQCKYTVEWAWRFWKVDLLTTLFKSCQDEKKSVKNCMHERCKKKSLYTVNQYIVTSSDVSNWIYIGIHQYTWTFSTPLFRNIVLYFCISTYCKCT